MVPMRPQSTLSRRSPAHGSKGCLLSRTVIPCPGELAPPTDAGRWQLSAIPVESSRLVELTAHMTSINRNYDELFETAFSETRRIQEMSPDEHGRWRSQFRLLPPNIPLGDGSHIDTTMDALRAIGDIGELWLQNTPSAQASISVLEIRELAIAIVGQIISGSYRDRLDADPKFKRVFTKILGERVASLSKNTMHYFPCHVFESADAPQFEIGPVRFMSRVDWLDLVEANAQSALGWVRPLRAYFEGQAPRPEAPVWDLATMSSEERQKSNDDHWKAKSTCDEVGACRWIAVVEVPDRLSKLSRTCAEVAVRVAVDAFGLALGHHDALDLRGPGDAKGATLTYQLLQVRGRDIPTSWSLDMPGLKGGTARYQDLLERTAELRGSAGKALYAFVNHNAPGPVPTLKKRWVEAMYWFGEARRESADFVSLVKAGIALDILTQGKKAGGILDLSCRLFGLEESDTIANNGMTLEKAVTAIYDDGRSQLSHGGRLGLLQEIPVSRQLAIDFSAKVLLQYLSCLVKYNGPDDVDSLLLEIPRLRT